MIFRFRDRMIDFSDRSTAVIMGILNVTPDSFSDGSLYSDPECALRHAREMHNSGAMIIDIGAESTRPGAKTVTGDEELARLMPVVEALVKDTDTILSIDTSKADVAEECLKCGAHIVNDVSGCKKDPRMAAVIKKYDAGVVLMHMRGEPATMQQFTDYDDVVSDVIREIGESINTVRVAGVSGDHIVIDPGIGFSKTVEQNLDIIRRFREFEVFEKPLLLGPSRKSFIGKTLKREADERLIGTLASIAVGVANGAQLVRVHDVPEVNDFLTMMHLLHG